MKTFIIAAVLAVLCLILSYWLGMQHRRNTIVFIKNYNHPTPESIFNIDDNDWKELACESV